MVLSFCGCFGSRESASPPPSGLVAKSPFDEDGGENNRLRELARASAGATKLAGSDTGVKVPVAVRPADVQVEQLPDQDASNRFDSAVVTQTTVASNARRCSPEPTLVRALLASSELYHAHQANAFAVSAGSARGATEDWLGGLSGATEGCAQSSKSLSGLSAATGRSIIPSLSPGQIKAEVGELVYIGQGATGLVYRGTLTCCSRQHPQHPQTPGHSQQPQLSHPHTQLQPAASGGVLGLGVGGGDAPSVGSSTAASSTPFSSAPAGSVPAGSAAAVSVAVKFMICNTPQQLWQRAKEALLSKLVSHPNLVRTLAMDVTLITPNTYREWGEKRQTSLDASVAATPAAVAAWSQAAVGGGGGGGGDSRLGNASPSATLTTASLTTATSNTFASTATNMTAFVTAASNTPSAFNTPIGSRYCSSIASSSAAASHGLSTTPHCPHLHPMMNPSPAARPAASGAPPADPSGASSTCAGDMQPIPPYPRKSDSPAGHTPGAAAAAVAAQVGGGPGGGASTRPMSTPIPPLAHAQHPQVARLRSPAGTRPAAPQQQHPHPQQQPQRQPHALPYHHYQHQPQVQSPNMPGRTLGHLLAAAGGLSATTTTSSSAHGAAGATAGGGSVGASAGGPAPDTLAVRGSDIVPTCPVARPPGVPAGVPSGAAALDLGQGQEGCHPHPHPHAHAASRLREESWCGPEGPAVAAVAQIAARMGSHPGSKAESPALGSPWAKASEDGSSGCSPTAVVAAAAVPPGTGFLGPGARGARGVPRLADAAVVAAADVAATAARALQGPSEDSTAEATGTGTMMATETSGGALRTGSDVLVTGSARRMAGAPHQSGSESHEGSTTGAWAAETGSSSAGTGASAAPPARAALPPLGTSRLGPLARPGAANTTTPVDMMRHKSSSPLPSPTPHAWSMPPAPTAGAHLAHPNMPRPGVLTPFARPPGAAAGAAAAGDGRYIPVAGAASAAGGGGGGGGGAAAAGACAGASSSNAIPPAVVVSPLLAPHVFQARVASLNGSQPGSAAGPSNPGLVPSTAAAAGAGGAGLGGAGGSGAAGMSEIGYAGAFAGAGGGTGGSGGENHGGTEPVPFQDILYHLEALPGRFLAKVIMEYCDSGTLLQRINAGDFVSHPDRGPLAMLGAMRSLLWCMQEVAAGMAHLHSLNIIHGDLKPSNVLLTSEASSPLGYVCKVSDFGLATALEASEQTITHENWGTVVYMAPESCAGRCRKASDVYSFGVLLWQMCTGQRPYAGMQAGQVLLGVKTGTLKLHWPAWANKSLVKVGQACMRFEPKERPGFKGIRSALAKVSARLDQKIAVVEAAGMYGEAQLLQQMEAARQAAAVGEVVEGEEGEDGVSVLGGGGGGGRVGGDRGGAADGESCGESDGTPRGGEEAAVAGAAVGVEEVASDAAQE